LKILFTLNAYLMQKQIKEKLYSVPSVFLKERSDWAREKAFNPKQLMAR